MFFGCAHIGAGGMLSTESSRSSISLKEFTPEMARRNYNAFCSAHEMLSSVHTTVREAKSTATKFTPECNACCKRIFEREEAADIEYLTKLSSELRRLGTVSETEEMGTVTALFSTMIEACLNPQLEPSEKLVPMYTPFVEIASTFNKVVQIWGRRYTVKDSRACLLPRHKKILGKTFCIIREIYKACLSLLVPEILDRWNTEGLKKDEFQPLTKLPGWLYDTSLSNCYYPDLMDGDHWYDPTRRLDNAFFAIPIE